jgi:hypothetical protein
MVSHTEGSRNSNGYSNSKDGSAVAVVPPITIAITITSYTLVSDTENSSNSISNGNRTDQQS